MKLWHNPTVTHLELTSDYNDISGVVFQRTSMPVLSDVVVNIFQLNRSVSSKWAVFGLCHCSVQ